MDISEKIDDHPCCDRAASAENGKIVAQGSSQELKQQTRKDSLEEAFLALTGSTIRDETANVSHDQLKAMARMWGNRR
jgi:ABC-2 type transport system ATP-binding protein